MTRIVARPGRSMLLALTSLCMALPAAAQEPGTAQRSVLEGVYTQAQSERGQAAFRSSCESCHSIGEFGAGFLRQWAGSRVQSLFDQVAANMPEDLPGSLPPQQYADIIAYILRTNGIPAGSSELPPDAQVLASLVLQPAP